jgi:DNA-directed RNA polymerase subunit omega
MLKNKFLNSEIAVGHVSKDILKQREQDYQTSSLDLALSANNLNLDGFSFQ